MFGPSNKKIHFFDLDNTLWRISGQVWVIDRESPDKPLLKLDNTDTVKIQNNLYKRDNLKVEYNENSYYISQDIFDKVSKKKKLDIDRLGLSWIEFYDDYYINHNEVKFLLGNIKHLSGSGDKICLLSGRAHLDRHEIVIGKLKDKLREMGLEVWKTYFVSDRMHDKYDVSMAIKKSNILLEHMVGLKMANNSFQLLKQDWFSDVLFYDDEFTNIDYANDLQALLDDILTNTKDEEVKKVVVDRVTNNTLKLTTNMVTNNEINRFKTNVLTLKLPVTYGFTKK